MFILFFLTFTPFISSNEEKARHPLFFQENSGYCVVYLYEENKSIKLQTLTWHKK